MGNDELITNREFKSSAFTAYFGMPENAAELFQALGKEKVRPDEIEFTTLQGVMYMARKNDLAFLAKRKVLVIGEHQSTINRNMPLRSAIYYGRTMEKLIPANDIYRKKQLPIPTPEFYVFYNGTEEYPAEEILKLSDAYLEKTEEPMLELQVKVININLSANHPLLQNCRPVYEYSFFIEAIRRNQRLGMNRDEAIRRAMQECKEADIMVDFIEEHGSEVSNMLFTQFNWDDALEVAREEFYEDGLLQGKREVLLDFLSSKGEISEELQARIAKTEDDESLREWVQLASVVETVEEFAEKAGLNK